MNTMDDAHIGVYTITINAEFDIDANTQAWYDANPGIAARKLTYSFDLTINPCLVELLRTTPAVAANPDYTYTLGDGNA